MATPSSSSIACLPGVQTLKNLLQSFAVLDAILCPEWEYRYYSFNAAWSAGQQMGSMRNGTGDEFFALFGVHGCFFKGFAHEYSEAMLTPEALNAVPTEYSAGKNEPAFSMDHTTFCYWRSTTAPDWSVLSTSPDNDGSELLLEHLDCNPETYKRFAEEYYEDEYEGEMNLPIDAIRSVYEHKPITEEILRSLNPTITIDAIASELMEIGYPKSSAA